MKKVSLDVLKPWITKRVNEILGMEDDVVIEYCFNQLEAQRVRFVLLFLEFLWNHDNCLLKSKIQQNYANLLTGGSN